MELNTKDDLISCKLIAANANTTLKCCDYNAYHRVLAFGSSNLIHIYDPSISKTYLTLNQHTDRVNSLKWFQNAKSPNDLIELMSVGSEGKIIHWVNTSKTKDPFNYLSWKMEKEYKSLDKAKSLSINVIETLFLSSIEKYFAVFTSNGVLDLFYFDVDFNEFKVFSSLNFNTKLQDTLCLTVLNDTHLVLLTGGYDSVINVHSVMRINKMNSIRQLNHNKEIQACVFKASLQGHTNGIRDIAAISPLTFNTNQMYFASCSQDNYIRTWHITKLESKDKTITDKINIKGTISIFDEYKSKTSYVINVEGDKNQEEYFNITLDSVLSGHENSISSIQWGKIEDSLVLLSSSFDFSVVIWKYDSKYNIWNKDVTLGEMIGNRHAFYYASFLSNYKEIIAYSYNGAFYSWKMDTDGQYKNSLVMHGHFGSVSDLNWDSSKCLLFTCSEDETTRVFANWKKKDTWHEINRPQIHGYELNALVCFNQYTDKEKDSNLICKLISGADEKLIRVFAPPFNIVKFTGELSEYHINFKSGNTNDYYEKSYSNVEGSKQALGLMNRQVVLDETENVEDDKEDAPDMTNFDPDAVLTNKTEQIYITRYDYTIPPNEDFLTNNTLWPEDKKLYGHGCEVFSLGISHDSKILASGQKAQAEKNAKLFLWDTASGKLINQLEGHTLTIVQIEFSPKDNYILTVSRDRTWCVFIEEESGKKYKLLQMKKSAHSRIIWSCSWTYDEQFFFTASRDKFIHLWEKGQTGLFSLNAKVEMEESVTAIHSIPLSHLSGIYPFVAGLENGEITFGCFNQSNKTIEIKHKLHRNLQHGKTVKRLSSVVIDDDKENGNRNTVIRIASCSEDHSVRVFEMKAEQLNNILK